MTAPEHSFDARWLSMREPYDHAARSAAMVDLWARALPHNASVLDLGCGLGSNLRYTAPRLAQSSRWLLADHDQRLLDAIVPSTPRFCINLDDPNLSWPETDAVTTQALLDLVGVSWLERLAQHLINGHRPLLAALSVDGRVSFHPSHPDDDLVMRLFRRHQLTSRGFGPSLGPHAAPWLAGRLSAAGFSVTLDEADWQIPGADVAMVHAMVEGIARAAAEISNSDAIRQWAVQRSHDTSHITVGHLDLVAIPSATGDAAREMSNSARS